MENGSGSGGGNGNGEEVFSNGGTRSGGGTVDEGAMQLLRRSLEEALRVLEHNRMLIQEITLNHDAGVPGSLTRNVALLRELNSNIARVVEFYASLSCCFSRSLILGNSAGAGAGADNRRRSSQ